MNRRIGQRRAVSMVELLLSLSISTVLMAGIASSMILASRAIPDPDSTLVSSITAYRSAEEMAGDLYTAMSFTERTTTAVEFKVADRDANDGETIPDTLRYEWLGTAENPLPLTRQYNGGAVISIADNVYELSLGYSVRTRSETVTQEVTTQSAETEIASFDGWSGISPTTNIRLLGPSTVDSQYFEIPPQAGATELRITRAALLLYYQVSRPTGVQIAIRRSTNDGSYEPMATSIGTPVTISGFALSTVPMWQYAVFSDVVITDPARKDYCLVATLVGTTSAYMDGYYSKSAPDNTSYQLWSADSGGSWDPRSNNIDAQDIQFYVYGVYSSTSTQDVTIIDGVNIKLRVGPDASSTAYTSVQILNAIEVVTP